MLAINYGINRCVGRRVVHRNGKLRVKGHIGHDTTRAKIFALIRARHPNWSITGYALAPAKKARHVFMVQERFVPGVRSGEKFTTVRLPRKRMPRPGDIIDLRVWSGKPYRSKQIKLREETITSVVDFEIETSGDFRINGGFIGWHLRDAVAVVDGFKDATEMVGWFKQTHGLPFAGFATEWIP